MKIQGKTLVITGGGNGIGRQVVLQALERGARVAAVDLREDSLQETARLAEAGERLSLHATDVSDQAAVEALPGAVQAAHGAVDGVVNVAGIIQPFVRLVDLDLADVRRVMDVNFWGVAYVTKAFLPLLLERPVAHVANVSSMGGFLPVPGQTAYGASKAAVKLFTEGLAAECDGTPVRVTIVFPGAIATDITNNSGVAAPAMPDDASASFPMTSASDAGRIILDAIERDAYRVTVGRDATMLDLAARWFPKRAARLITRQMKALLPDR